MGFRVFIGDSERAQKSTAWLRTGRASEGIPWVFVGARSLRGLQKWSRRVVCSL